MVLTLRDVVGSVRHRLSGVGTYSERVTALDGPLDAVVTDVQVEDVPQSARLLEVGLEVMRVKAADATSATVRLWPFGRGYQGTTAAAHDSGSEVLVDPDWFASTIAQECNGVLREVYPTLYGVREFEGAYTTPFALPLEATGVIAVFRAAPSGGWNRVDDWRFEPDSGNGLTVRFAALGELVRVVYGFEPGVFDLTDASALGSGFEAVTGLPDRVSDVLALGVAYRLAPFVDLGRIASAGAEAKADQRDQSGGANLSRLLFAEFKSRLDQESSVLQREHPIRLHRAR